MPDSSLSPRTRFGVFEVDLRAGELRKRGLKVKLHGRPFQVLALLLERPGEPVTREELREKLWPADTFVDFDHGLSNAVNKLREALGDSADNPRFVETLPRRGYRFIAPVETPGQAVSEPRARLRPVWVGALAVVALLVVLVGLNVRGLQHWLLGGPAPGEIISIAVLPLENLSADPEQEYFVDGMTEALITTLSKIEALKVISRTSAMRYKGSDKPLPEIARELGVDAVVEGSVLRAGDQVRIAVQLIYAATDENLWAESYQRDLTDVLALQNDVARAITNEIKLELTPDERMRLDSVQTVNPESHQAYLKGRYLWNKRTRKDLEKAIGYFETAIDEDPEYALAYAGLSNAYRALSSSHLPPREVMPKAKAAATKALELDEALAEAHISLAVVNLTYDWDLPAAKKELDRAIELNPNAAEAYALLGLYLTAIKRHEEAVPVIKRALEINPLSHSVHFKAGWAFFLSQQYEQAIAQCQDAIGIDSNFFWAHAIQGLAYAQNGQFPQAIAASETATQIDDSPLILALLAHTYALAGKEDLARKVLADLMEKAKSRYVCAYEVALAYVGLGDKQEALQWLEKAYRERADCMLWLRVDTRLDPIRDDPRFQALLRRMNFPE